METVRELTYLGDRACETAVIDRTRCGWVKFRECDELLYSKRFPQS